MIVFFGDFTGSGVADAFIFIQEILVVDQDLLYGVGVVVTFKANVAPHGIVPVLELASFGARPALTDLASDGFREKPDTGFFHINAFRMKLDERGFPVSSFRFPASMRVSMPPPKKKESRDLISDRFSKVLGSCFLRVIWPGTSPRTIKPLDLQRL